MPVDIKFRDVRVEGIKADLLVLPVRERRLDEVVLQRLDRRLKGNLRERMRKSNFTGSEGSGFLYGTAGLLPAAQILVVGLGSGSDAVAEIWRKTGARVKKEAAAVVAEQVAVFLSPDKDAETVAAALVEGVSLASYQFTRYRSI
jgi:leucyl aminopeptidase